MLTNLKAIPAPPFKFNNYLQEELFDLIKTDDAIFTFIQNYTLDGLWFWDLENPENEWMDAKFWNTLGYDAERMPHKSAAWQSIINQEDYQNVMVQFQKHCEDPSYTYDQEVRYQHKMGHTIWIRCRGIVIRDDKGKPTRMLGAHTDITKLKKTELQLRKQIEHYKHIIEETQIGTWEMNIETKQLILNERWAEIIGYTLVELEPITYESWINNIHPDDVQKYKETLTNYLNKEKSIYQVEYRMKHKNGNWVWILDRGKTVSCTTQENHEWIIGSHQDITAQKRDVENYKLFIESAPCAIAMLDTNLCYISHSKKWLIDYKIEGIDIIGKSHYEIFPEIKEEWKQDHRDCLSGKILRSDEDSFQRPDGTVQWIAWELHPWYDRNNKVGGVIMLTTDITHAKNIELKLRLSEQTFRGNFENAAIGMSIADLKGKFSTVNESFCKMIGYTAEELCHLDFRDITHPNDIASSLSILQQLNTGEISNCHLEKRYLHKNGKTIHVIVSISTLNDDRGNPQSFIVQIVDVTPRIQARKQLEKTLAELEGILEASTQVSIIQTNTKGIITKFNRGAENLLGYQRDEVITKKKFNHLFVEDEVKSYGNENASKNTKDNFEKFETFKTPLKAKKHFTKEWLTVRKDNSKFPVQLTTTKIVTNGKTTGYLGVATDISEIKKVTEELQSLLSVANDQNDRLKNFAHIVSHNLKSHSGNFSMLLNLYLEENPELKDHEIMQLFNMACTNLSDTIEHLNEVVLINTSVENHLTTLNLHDAIEKSKSHVYLSAKKEAVAIENQVSPEITILGVPAYIDSILLNFLTNGIRYCSIKEIERFIKLKAYVACSKYVVLEIKDNGLGIDLKRHHSKLFGMYKTFHHRKEARGIGLFITKNQVESLGGKIEVESEVGVGTTFKIYLTYEKEI